MALNAKQEAFCREYIIDLNATQAAIRAGYSERSANQFAARLMAKDSIQARIAELSADRSARTQITADWVLEQAANSYKFNAQEVFDSEGNPKMVNAAAAAKFLELTGKHVNVKAFEEAKQTGADESLSDAVNKLIDRLPS